MPSRLPERLQPWWGFCDESGHRHGADPCLVISILDCESHGKLRLTPPEPWGTGDFPPRKWTRYEKQTDAATRYHRFTEDGDEWCVPADRLGWGRGLMQPDWGDVDNFEFFAKVLADGTPAWKDPQRNIDWGAYRLGQHLHLFEKDADPEVWATARYNASLKRVMEARTSLHGPATREAAIRAADMATFNKHYVSDVLSRRDQNRRLLSLPPLPS